MSARDERSFLEALRAPVDSPIYRRGAGWRWVAWGTIGFAERAVKLAAYLGATLLPLAWWLRGELEAAGPLPFGQGLAGWTFAVLTALQLLDVHDKWLIGDRLSMAIMVPRLTGHLTATLLFFCAAPSPRVFAFAFVIGASLSLGLGLEAIFLRRHLGRELDRPGVKRELFWIFWTGYALAYGGVALWGAFRWLDG